MLCLQLLRFPKIDFDRFKQPNQDPVKIVGKGVDASNKDLNSARTETSWNEREIEIG